MKMDSAILQRVYKLEERYNIKYAKKDGALFNRLRLLYILACTYFFVFAVITILGLLLKYSAEGILANEVNTFIQIGISVIAAIVGLVFCVLKITSINAAFTLVSFTFGTMIFSRLLPHPDGLFELMPRFYWAHFAPLALCLIFALAMLFIAVREKLKLKKEYETVCARLYEQYKKLAEDTSEEEWQEFLANSNKDIFSKKKK